MRILLFLSDFDGGGAQRTFVNLANGMFDKSIDIKLVVGRSGGPAQKWLSEKIPFIDLRVKKTRFAIKGLRSEIRLWRPDVLLATMVDANIVASLASVGLRKSMMVLLRETNSHRARGDIVGLRRALIRWSYKSADKIVALSSGVREELLTDYYLDGQSITTIGNPVDIHGIRKSAKKNVEFPLELPGAKNVPIILAIGRLTRQKGFDHLITSFARLKNNAHLVILGEGPERENLISLAEREKVSDKIYMPGFVENTAAWLANSNIFVLSSRWEGFGHVIVEAMAVGVPVIATDCPHGPSDIISDGINGILVKNCDPGALSLAIDELLADRTKASILSKAGQLRAEDYDIKRIMGKYFSLINTETI